MAIVLKLKKGESVERGLKRMKKILRAFSRPSATSATSRSRASRRARNPSAPASATVRAAAAWSSTKAPRGIKRERKGPCIHLRMRGSFALRRAVGRST